ncbi:MAG: hypothetical protein U1E05_08370 [Patescibacteria group bacterium]|nr:hypothetical protein [Patescibacteria group bacterium]
MQRLSGQFPVVLLCGARQSGKTTLLKHLCGPDRAYASLDDPSLLRLATDDPQLFLRQLQLLMQKATELEDAGRQDEADAISREVMQLRAELTEQLARLEQEVQRLRQLTCGGPSVLISVQVLELTCDNPLAAGLRGLKHPASPRDSTESDDAVPAEPGAVIDLKPLESDAEKALASLVAAKGAKVLASPILVGVEGRPVMFSVGGELPVLWRGDDGTHSIEYRHVGTKLEIVPEWIAEDHVRLAVQIRVAELDHDQVVNDNGVQAPALRTIEAATTVAVPIGQTVRLGGLMTRTPRENAQIVVLLRANRMQQAGLTPDALPAP